MVNGISSGVNQVQLFNATNAFKTAAAKPQSQIMPEPQVAEGVNVNDSQNILKNLDVDEVKKYASMTGENNLSDDDIKYGLVYGRSVMADWMV